MAVITYRIPDVDGPTTLGMLEMKFEQRAMSIVADHGYSIEWRRCVAAAELIKYTRAFFREDKGDEKNKDVTIVARSKEIINHVKDLAERIARDPQILSRVDADDIIRFLLLTGAVQL